NLLTYKLVHLLFLLGICFYYIFSKTQIYLISFLMHTHKCYKPSRTSLYLQICLKYIPYYFIICTKYVENKVLISETVPIIISYTLFKQMKRSYSCYTVTSSFFSYRLCITLNNVN